MTNAPHRTRMLHEMGLSPQWVLRAKRSIVRREETSSAPQPTAEIALERDAKTTQARPSSESVTSIEQQQPDTERAERIARMSWDELPQSVADCRACGLCAQRKQAVLGVGDQTADWLFVGEGPGAEEDARGEPFVGQAGKLLDAMLAAIDLKRGEDVYIANAVKCRPPGNRTPEAAEIATCAPYLKRQIVLIQPKLIVLLGRAAVHAVLGQDSSLASLRGKPLAYHDGQRSIPVVVTYHPAYLLRNLPDKLKSWEDLCRARALMRELKNTAGLEKSTSVSI